jgi:hypothetical protein
MIDIQVQVRTHHFNLGQKTKQLNKALRRNISLGEARDRLEAEIARADSLFAQLTEASRGAGAAVAGSKSALETAGEEFDEIERAKHLVRKAAKKQRDVEVDLKRRRIRQDNERSRLVRRIQAGSHTHKIVLTRQQQEKNVTTAVEGMNVDLEHEIRAEKSEMQSEKMKLRGCEREIEQKHVELSRVVAQRILAIDDRQNDLDKLAEGTERLAEFLKKKAQQSELAEDFRTERNALKHKYEGALREEVSLLNNLRDATLLRDELLEKRRQKELQITDQHFRWREAEQQIFLLEAGVEELSPVVGDANQSIAALQGEAQWLKQILSEAGSDRLLQAKEFDAARDAQKAVTGILVERRTTIDVLKDRIKILEMNIDQGLKDYAAKSTELKTLNREAMIAIEKNTDLKRKLEKLQFAQQERRRLFNLISRETEKATALTNEATVPRNVHRWDMAAAIDPGYARGCHYLSRLYGRIDAAHRTLLEIGKERDALRMEFEEKSKLRIPRVESQPKSYPQYIESYKADVATKEEQIGEMAHEIATLRGRIVDVQDRIDRLRGKVNDRRSACSQLRGRNMASKEAKRELALFMTEPLDAIPLGGGFLLKFGPEPTREADTDVSSTRKLREPRKTATETPRMLRPKAAIPKRRPQTSYATANRL